MRLFNPDIRQLFVLDIQIGETLGGLPYICSRSIRCFGVGFNSIFIMLLHEEFDNLLALSEAALLLTLSFSQSICLNDVSFVGVVTVALAFVVVGVPNAAATDSARFLARVRMCVCCRAGGCGVLVLMAAEVKNSCKFGMGVAGGDLDSLAIDAAVVAPLRFVGVSTMLLSDLKSRCFEDFAFTLLLLFKDNRFLRAIIPRLAR